METQSYVRECYTCVELAACKSVQIEPRTQTRICALTHSRLLCLLSALCVFMSSMSDLSTRGREHETEDSVSFILLK